MSFMDDYRGITYPHFLCRRPILWLWKKWMCCRNIHLLDECASPDDHSLVCDACDLSIYIGRIVEYEKDE